MLPEIPLKKLLSTALVTSIIIGALAIAPIAVIHRIPPGGLLKGMAHHALFIFLIWSVNIGLVYITEKYSHKKFPVVTRYVLSYVVCILLIVLIRVILRPIPHQHDPETFLRHNPAVTIGRGGEFAGVIMGLALNTIVLIIQDLILLGEKKSRIELENAELKIKNIESVNQQLKQQIHPHFLFNALNTLKTLIRKSPGKAENYLVKLSEFLRASISSSTPNSVPVRDEIKLCLNYLEMQKMRFGDALKYEINIPHEIQNSGYVPVFSLLPLLENAIKHNVLTVENPLRISIDYENDRIVTRNNYQPKEQIESSTGLGLENLAARYAILSGDKISVSKDENTFSVSIKVLPHEYSDHRR